jgi:hypothetical protein
VKTWYKLILTTLKVTQPTRKKTMNIDKFSIGINLINIGTISLLLSIGSAQAAQRSQNIEKLPVEDRLISQAFLDSRCPGESVHLVGATKKFKVTICGQNGVPTHYIADRKNGASGIILPIASYTSTQFVARNGKSTYTLIIYEGGNGAGKLIVKAPGKRPQIENFEMYLP